MCVWIIFGCCYCYGVSVCVVVDVLFVMGDWWLGGYGVDGIVGWYFSYIGWF